MVDVGFVLIGLDKKEYYPSSVAGFELNRDKNAPCDSLRLYLSKEKYDVELYAVKAYAKGKLIFDGLVDTQKEKIDKNGIYTYIFARSKASVLTDNEVSPCVYYSPSSDSVFLSNIIRYGFKNEIPLITSNTPYQVDKGTSCFRVLDDFVYNNAGCHIMVTPQGTIKLMESDKVVDIPEGKIQSITRCIRRSNALTDIHYKINNDDNYDRHCNSRFFVDKSISRTCYKNLSALSDNQRTVYIKNVLNNACEDYQSYHIVIDGWLDIGIVDEVMLVSAAFGNIEDAYVSSISHIMDNTGFRTVVDVVKKLDFQEMYYVD